MPRFVSLLLLCALAGAPARAAEEAPGAYDLLQRVRDAYSALGTYRDEGEIQISGAEAGSAPERHQFRSALSAEGGFELRFETRPAADSARAETEPDVLTRFGPGAREALIVPILLEHGATAIPDPAAAMVEGRQSCGASECWLLAGAGPEDGVSWRLWIDVETDLVHRVEVEVPAAGERRFVVDHRVLEATRRDASAAADGQTATAPEAGFSESIEVALTTVTVRVVDRSGAPISTLGPGDFRIVVGKREVEVESAEWVDPAKPWGDDLPIEELEAAGIEPPRPGRLIVFFVQTSLHGSRLVGQVRMSKEAQRFLGTLGPDDRVAVVSYDSHLKLRQDFTIDRDRVRDALERSITASAAPLPRPGGAFSIVRHFEAEEAKRATSPERALELTARALIPIEGPKLIVYLGWGLGEMTPEGIQMRRGYEDALRAINAAEATVFVLDVSDSDYHSLEFGLRRVAADTGGTYEKTQDFARAATDRLTKTLSGHYLIYFRAPPAPSGTSVRVVLRKGLEGEVLSPSFVTN